MALETTRLPPIVPERLKMKPRGRNTVVHPYDPVDEHAGRWFPGLDRPNLRSPNEVIPYIDGKPAFKDMVSAIRTAKKDGHFIYLVGWRLIHTFALIDGDSATTIEQLFTKASHAHVDIRVMLFRQTAAAKEDNTPAVDFIKSLPTGKVIHDDRVVEGSPLTQGTSYWSNAPYVGVHHQKILIVYGTEGLVVFQGGMDIREDRLHFPGPKAPWGLHDVQTRVRGTAAHALWKVFMERWSDHPSSAAYPGIFVQPSILPKIKADLQVEVGRTYPNCAKHPLYPNNASYSFAPNGERSARAMVLNAISQSKRFIYIEDQYLFDMSISDALKAALPNISKLIILINEAAYTRDQRQTCYRRKLFIDNLTGGKQPPTDKVIVCQNRVTDKADERVPFVHSKTFIFDDKFAIVGSANINRRGYTHDSEQSVGIFDTNKKKKFFFAHELRMNLWAKLLALRPIDLVDPIASSVHWSSPTGHIMTYTVDQQDPPLKFPENLVPKDVLWDQGLDPDGS